MKDGFEESKVEVSEFLEIIIFIEFLKDEVEVIV